MHRHMSYKALDWDIWAERHACFCSEPWDRRSSGSSDALRSRLPNNGGAHHSLFACRGLLSNSASYYRRRVGREIGRIGSILGPVVGGMLLSYNWGMRRVF